MAPVEKVMLITTNVSTVANVASVANVAYSCSFSLMSLISCLKTLITHPTRDPMNTNITYLATLGCEFNSHKGSAPRDYICMHNLMYKHTVVVTVSALFVGSQVTAERV